MSNLFEQALDVEEQVAYQSIKENKSFLLKLIEDLKQYYHIYLQIKDEHDGSIIYIAPFSNYRFGDISFIADKNGVRFVGNILCYHSVSQKSEHNRSIKQFGAMYEKYKDTGTTAENNFKIVKSLGDVKFIIPIAKENNRETLKDIMYILEHVKFKRNF